jgi:predicted cobalt transporter CbtA
MIRPLLVRGMLVGLVAGLLAFVFAKHFGEPHVQKAIAFEEMVSAAHSHGAGEVQEEVITRGTQRGIGLFVGMTAMGIALGGIFSLVFAYAYGRMSAFRARGTAALLGLAAFVTITLIPFTKYPPNPPATGDPDTITKRTLLYVTMIAITVLSALAAARLRRQLLPQRRGWNASLLAAALFIVVVSMAQLILPTVSEIPEGFPADTLYRFRLASLGINATVWASIAIGFGMAAERLLESAPRTSAAANPSAA